MDNLKSVIASITREKQSTIEFIKTVIAYVVSKSLISSQQLIVQDNKVVIESNDVWKIIVNELFPSIFSMDITTPGNAYYCLFLDLVSQMSNTECELLLACAKGDDKLLNEKIVTIDDLSYLEPKAVSKKDDESLLLINRHSSLRNILFKKISVFFADASLVEQQKLIKTTCGALADINNNTLLIWLVRFKQIQLLDDYFSQIARKNGINNSLSINEESIYRIVNWVNNFGMSALCYGAYHGCVYTCQLLLQNGAFIEQPSSLYHVLNKIIPFNPFARALVRNQRDVVALFLRVCFDPHDKALIAYMEKFADKLNAATSIDFNVSCPEYISLLSGVWKKDLTFLSPGINLSLIAILILEFTHSLSKIKKSRDTVDMQNEIMRSSYSYQMIKSLLRMGAKLNLDSSKSGPVYLMGYWEGASVSRYIYLQQPAAFFVGESKKSFHDYIADLSWYYKNIKFIAVPASIWLLLATLDEFYLLDEKQQYYAIIIDLVMELLIRAQDKEEIKCLTEFQSCHKVYAIRIKSKAIFDIFESALAIQEAAEHLPDWKESTSIISSIFSSVKSPKLFEQSHKLSTELFTKYAIRVITGSSCHTYSACQMIRFINLPFLQKTEDVELLILLVDVTKRKICTLDRITMTKEEYAKTRESLVSKIIEYYERACLILHKLHNEDDAALVEEVLAEFKVEYLQKMVDSARTTVVKAH